MSRDGYEGWDAPPRSREAASGPRSHRRRGAGPGDDRRPADGRDDAGYEYGSDGYADTGDYGSRQYAGPDGYADGQGGDYRNGADPAAGYGREYQEGYGRDRYADNGYAGQGQDGGGYADGYDSRGYADGYDRTGQGGGYADDGYGGGYRGDGRDSRPGRDPYAARDPYTARDPYATGDHGSADPYATADYRSADPYARPDPRASGPHGMTDPRAGADPFRRGSDSYDADGGFPAQGGYADPAGYADAAGYSGQDDYSGQDGYGGQDRFAGHDPYGSRPSPGYEPGEYAEQDEDLYRWRDPGAAQGAGAEPGSARRRRGGREDDFDAEDPRHDGFFRGFGGGGDDDHGGRGRGSGRSRPPKQRKSHAGLIALTIVLAIFAGVAYTGYHYYSLYKLKHSSYTGSGYGSTEILVHTGDTLDSITSQLINKGVIKEADPWAAYVANKSGLQPGKYKIHIHMSPAAAYAALTNPKNVVVTKVTIPDGLRESAILPLMAKDSGIPLSQFESAIKNTAALGLPSYANGNPEGYLYPDTYDVAPGETALKILQTAVAQFNAEATSLNLAAAAAHVGYTPAQIITGASLLEAEVGPTYYGDVARTIDNRINQGMALQLDSTVAYATGKYIYNLSQSDLNVNSPYNTFLHKDLPPGPIDSPDAAAIQAFLTPPKGDWLYFVTVDKKGTTNFTNSYSQFQTWSTQAKQNGV